ncbi:mannitol dehydrogenase [Anaerocolumna cellulosilytica]|uniref:Mannitol dehydrogenase n=1 Tax=Anaerocolumna cellulosilytica TaxID=433286 RepID=A0A6S6R651_9FIRM|nr:mannitol dehydrogenase family protein [Anaerocolumna cellulosilytica]MBB5197884.1 fructuronate reductase [Anaerocolumna cellulosilytica]BCJ95567.1 mannitol dehydrogenase [Anaerocolumna cellulosilytica]
MKLKLDELNNRQQWEEKGYEIPAFSIEKMKENTKHKPEWVHFGGGNIFRAFPAAVCQELLNQGIMESGIIVAEGYDYEIIEHSYKNSDNLTLLVTLMPDGNLQKKVIASVAEALCVDTANTSDWNRLVEIFKNPSLKVVSFTITEKGYSLKSQNGEYMPAVAKDFKNNPKQAESYIGKLVALCYERFLAGKLPGNLQGKLPLALVSMDNCSHNGSKLKEAVTSFAKIWVENGITAPEFLEYVSEDISYPWSMIDKITPRPADSVLEILKADGFEDTEAYITSKNTYIAPFVNAEAPQYLVIEDAFNNGKLPLDLGGIIYTDRATVDKVEKMKVCTCLNPLHTALAIFGCLLSYDKISDEMKDQELTALIKKIGYQEGLPVVVDPGIIKPADFLQEVLSVRLPNPFMPDTPQRIACDTSQKLSIRFGETIKAYIERPDLDVTQLTFIPLVLAGWCRYLMGVNDKGQPFELSPDPMLNHLVPLFSDINLGENIDVTKCLKDILSNDLIFGVDLYKVGLGEKIEGFFKEMIKGEGAVRDTLKKYLDEEQHL